MSKIELPSENYKLGPIDLEQSNPRRATAEELYGPTSENVVKETHIHYNYISKKGCMIMGKTSIECDGDRFITLDIEGFKPLKEYNHLQQKILYLESILYKSQAKGYDKFLEAIKQ